MALGGTAAPILGLGTACEEDELSHSEGLDLLSLGFLHIRMMRGDSLIDWSGMGFLWFIVRKFGWNVVGRWI